MRAKAIPTPNPRTPPTIKAVLRSGKIGASGRIADCVTKIETGAEPSVPSPSVSSMAADSEPNHASASATASAGVVAGGRDADHVGVCRILDGDA